MGILRWSGLRHLFDGHPLINFCCIYLPAHAHTDSVAPMIHEDFPGVGQYNQPPVERSRRGSFDRAPRKSIGTYVVYRSMCLHIHMHLHRADFLLSTFHFTSIYQNPSTCPLGKTTPGLVSTTCHPWSLKRLPLVLSVMSLR